MSFKAYTNQEAWSTGDVGHLQLSWYVAALHWCYCLNIYIDEIKSYSSMTWSKGIITLIIRESVTSPICTNTWADKRAEN